MQDYYPSDENGNIFDTESGFYPLFFLSVSNCVDTVIEKIPDNRARKTHRAHVFSTRGTL